MTYLAYRYHCTTAMCYDTVVPWYTTVYNGGLPWYTMVYQYTMVYHDVPWYIIDIPWYIIDIPWYHGTPLYTVVYHGTTVS